MSLSRNALASLLSSSTPLIVHHWDADGVISAVTATQFVGQGASFLVPGFTYEPGPEFYGEVSSEAADKDLVLVLDYSAPAHVLASMVTAAGRPVVVVDHHVAKYPRVSGLLYYNPAAEGDPTGLWPSAAHVLADALGFYDPLLVAASIYGDLMEEAARNRVFRAYMEEVGLDPESDVSLPRDCALQIWGAEAHMDVEVIRGLAYSLSYGAADPCQALLSDPRLTNMRVSAEEEVNRLVAEASSSIAVKDGIGVASVRTRLRVGGMVARRLLSEVKGLRALVVSIVEGGNVGRVYVRGPGFDPGALSERLRSKWASVGAKKQQGNMVVSLQVSADRLDEAVNDVLTALRS